MLSLNIIPDEIKKEIKLFNILTIVKNYFYIIFIFLCIYSCVFLIFKLALINHFNETVDRSNFISKKTEDNSNKIRGVNSLLNSVERVQNDFVAWSNLLSYVGQITDDAISMKQIKVSKTEGTIILSGNAATRDALLKLKNEIEKSAYFKDLDFPIKNILEKENINFEITAKIKSYEFE